MQRKGQANFGHNIILIYVDIFHTEQPEGGQGVFKLFVMVCVLL